MKKLTLSNGGFARVDDEDYNYLSQYVWTANKDNNGVTRAIRTYGSKKHRMKVYMHREIIDAPVNMVIDHINGNGLDNRKSNLRVCTKAQNLMNRRAPRNNTSGYKGVSYDKSRNKWVAQLKVNQKRVLSKRFNTKEEAARAYNNAAIIHFGEFAYLNTL